MQELRALVDGYAVAADERDAAAFRALFADDAWLDVNGHRYEGADAIAGIPAKLARYERTLHLVSTHLVRDDGAGRPTGVAYCEAHHLADGGDRVLHLRYDDAYVRTGAGWRFASRTLTTVREEQR